MAEIFNENFRQESYAIAKMSARCTIRQYAHGLKLESPLYHLVPIAGLYIGKIRQKRPPRRPQRRNQKQKYGGDPKNRTSVGDFL